MTGMYDVIVLGAGLSGLLTAYELRRAGLQVLVVDRGALAREASWAGGGILSPIYPWRYPDSINELACWSQRAYPKLVAALCEQTAIDAEYEACGLALLDSDECAAAREWATRWGHSVSVHSEPNSQIANVSETAFNSWIWFSEIAQVRNPRLCQALIKALEDGGVTLRPNTIPQLVVRPGRVVAIQIASERISTRYVVVAAGAWSTGLSHHLRDVAVIRPVKGQMLLYQADPDLLGCMVLKCGRYLIPRRDGHILVGSTVEEVGFDRTTTYEARQELSAFAQLTVPALDGTLIKQHWAGLRPATADGVPYIGEHPDVAGLFVNAGHYRNGVVMAPASARLTADLLLERQPCLDPSPYRLGRNAPVEQGKMDRV